LRPNFALQPGRIPLCFPATKKLLFLITGTLCFCSARSGLQAQPSPHGRFPQSCDNIVSVAEAKGGDVYVVMQSGKILQTIAK